jgi:hypothetical protein
MFITIAFICMTLLGNMCLIKSAHAQDSSNNPHAVRMSVRETAKCPWINKSVAPADAEKTSPCATGHCFGPPQQQIADTALHGFALMNGPAVIPSSPVQELVLFSPNPIEPEITGSPPFIEETRSVVLRC